MNLKNRPYVFLDPVKLSATKRPPFGHEVERAIKTGQTPNVYIYAGPNSWAQALRHRLGHGCGTAMLLPFGDDPRAYRWPVVSNGLLIVANGQPREMVFHLAHAVVSRGTPIAHAIFCKFDAFSMVRSTRLVESTGASA